MKHIDKNKWEMMDLEVLPDDVFPEMKLLMEIFKEDIPSEIDDFIGDDNKVISQTSS